LSKRRRRPKLRAILELWVLSIRRRRSFPHCLGTLDLEDLEQEEESLMYEGLEQAMTCLM
jgi:hypothetical protein